MQKSSIDAKIKEVIKDIELLTGRKVVNIKRGTRGIVLIAETGAGMPEYVAYKTTVEVLENKALESFVREARRMFYASGHPLILTPYYIVKIRGRPLICMRYADMSLRDYLVQRGKLSVEEALVLAIQIVKGLLYLRKRGISAHQDLKPENILLEDLSRSFDVKPPLHLRVRIADFGLANAWKEAGIPGGTNPYRASEQFAQQIPSNLPEEYFNPDVFALGVILTEMITGFHPCGLSWEKVKKIASDTKFWQNWALNGERVLRGIDEPRLKQLITRMLDPAPNNRPSLEEVYNMLMEMLKDINREVYEQLKLQLEYYDALAEYYIETGSWISDLLKLAEIGYSKQLDFILNTLSQERERVRQPKTPQGAVYLCRLNYAIGKILLRKNKDKFKEKIIELAKEIIDIVRGWKDRIKTEHVYVPLRFKDKEIIKLSNIRDYEVHAEIMGYGIKLLKNVLNEDEILDLLNSYHDDYVKSLYHYLRASEARLDGASIKAYIEELNKAISLTPQISVLHYFKALWIHQWITLTKELGHVEVDKETICTMLKDALNECKRAIELDNTWREPSKLLRELESIFDRLC